MSRRRKPAETRHVPAAETSPGRARRRPAARARVVKAHPSAKARSRGAEAVPGKAEVLQPAVADVTPEEAEVAQVEEAEVVPAEAELVEPADLAADGAEALPDEQVQALAGAGTGSPLRKALPAPQRDREPAGGLVRYDPLRAYMAEVARHPVLTREEEHELALRFYRTGDVQAAYRLVAANLRLVVKIAHEYRRAAFQVLDLIQEGNIGLMQAVQKYDPFKGVKLSTYAAWWIRAYIIRFIMDNWRLVKLGTTQAQRKLFFNLSKEREKLLVRGVEPTLRLLAQNLRVEEKDVEEMSMRMGSEDLSLDAPARGDEDSAQTKLDRLSSAAPGADEQIGDEELRRLFREKLEAFAATIADERERAIFRERLLPPEGVEPRTLQEIGARFNLTRERARQIEAKLTARLREYLQAEIPDFELLGPPE